MAVVFSLPRLVGGGHWLTDDIVGGGFLSLTTLAWGLATPLHTKSVEWIERGIGKIIEKGKTIYP